MAATRKQPRFTWEIEAPANGRVRKAAIHVRNKADKRVYTDEANLNSDVERRKLVKRVIAKLGGDEDQLLEQLEELWNETLDRQRRMQEQAAAVETVQLLDTAPRTIRRPLCLVDGRAYCAAWVPLERTTSRSVDPASGAIQQHNPPLVTVDDVLLIVAGDGTLYADPEAPNARRFADLGLVVRLPAAPPPERGWSGAGVKRYLAGERPDPAEVFARLVSVVDRFIDFARSLADQRTMCELVAAYVLASYLLDAFHVVGYFWPNGERGAGKTTFLQVVTELAYLGQLILGGSSYACLRDLADYGATLAFDDAEGVMDARRTDPDKRTLLLAGNRTGATVAVKELVGDCWVTRHVNTFCPRLFSAIRLPDEVLGSRSIVVPLVRSADPRRAKANPLDPQDWPTDRRRVVDDLWALGLAHLPELPEHDRQAAAAAELSGRNLDPWRPILAVAHWLQHRHGGGDLFSRLEALSRRYQQVERSETEAEDRTRVLFRALLAISQNAGPDEQVRIRPGDVAQAMNDIARDEDLADPDKPFTTARRVGWLLRRLRFERGERNNRAKEWTATRQEIEAAAAAYGVDRTQEQPGQSDEEIRTPF
jgi:hypothetical protein